MAVTENTYTGNGSTTSYALTFQYIDEDDIKVSLNGTDTTAYTLANATTVLFNTAPANGVAIRIYRRTNVDSLKATFFAGSAIRAQDLNEDFLQNNYAVQEIQNNTWDKETQTIHSDEAWVSSDTQIATTAAMDARFQDEATETITSAEVWPDNDDTVATTAAIDNRVDSKIDAAITGDIATDGTGITITNDGDGTITLGLGSGLIDLDRIKDEDIITYAEQNAGSPSWDSDGRIATTYAAARRFDTLVQTSTPTGSNWQVGKTWLQNDTNLTLSVWNGSAWLGIASGGTFTNQPKVVYVDATAGDNNNDGHRISRPKATIKAAINQINADATYGDGSVVIVAAGVYQEAAPIQINKKNVSIIGQALRSCIVHPTSATETNTLFELNSGSYVANLTLTGMKAGTGTGNTLDSTLPTTQGWNFAFRSGATITKSPYIQNCTNFSDSEIDNDNLNAVTPAGGAAGDIDSDPTGGGLLVNGATVDSASPLRSMVCDSYTHVGLNGPGILVTNNGYVQATSSYAFFNKYHIKCLNGGQANLAASTTDFGDQALVADGKSTTNIFTSTVNGNFLSGVDTFTINAPTADASWHGSATRPQTNMLVTVNSVTYPILSAVANGSGWDVEISRPDPTNRSNNLGLNGGISNGAAVQFFLRSQIASSGHTMEYVGSGTDYRALPENGGVPVDANQVVESNDGKVWTATTDHNGKFKIGDFFEVDQQLGYVTIPNGSIAFDLASDPTPQLGGNLDVNGNTITSTSNANVVIDPNGTGTVDVSTSRITSVTDPTDAQDAATKNYVDTELSGISSNSISQDNTNVTVTDNGTDPGQIDFTVDGTNYGRYNVAGGLTLGNNLNVVTALSGGTSIVSLNSGGIVLEGTGSAAADRAQIRFTGTTIADYVSFRSPGNFTGTTVFNLPTADGTADQVLTTDGSGTLSFADAASPYPAKGASGTNQWAVVHSSTVDADYSIPSGSHVINAGPMTVNSGVTVTIPTGSNWVIV